MFACVCLWIPVLLHHNVLQDIEPRIDGGTVKFGFRWDCTTATAILHAKRPDEQVLRVGIPWGVAFTLDDQTA